MGLLDMMGQGDSGFANWLDPRRNFLQQTFAGMVGQDNLKGALQGASQGAVQGGQLDTVANQAREEKARQQETQNATIQYMAQNGFDDLVAGVQSGGMDIGAAWTEALRRKQPNAPDYGFTFAPDGTLIRTEGNSGQFDAMGSFPKPEEGPSTIIENNLGGTDKFYDEFDKNLATQQADLLEAGMNAQSNEIRLGQLENLLASAPQGIQGGMTSIAGQFGIPVEGLNEVQAAEALISQMVPEQRPPGSGQMSDADLALFKRSLPSIMNQPGGNQLIIRTARAINQYTIQLAEIARQVANRQISPAEGRALQAQVPNPLAEFNSGAVTGDWIDMGNNIRIRPLD